MNSGGVIGSYSDGKPKISYCIIDLKGNVLAENNKNRQYYAASTLKIAIMLAILRKIQNGELFFDSEYICELEYESADKAAPKFGFADDPDEQDPEMPAAGERITLAKILERMIIVSSNEASNMAIKIVGFEALADEFVNAGCEESTFERLYGDIAGRELGLSMLTSASDLAKLMLICLKGAPESSSAPVLSALREDMTEYAISLLKKQEYSVFGDALGKYYTWGSKSGWVTGIRHDVGFAYAKSKNINDAIIIAICSDSFEENQANIAISSQALLAAQSFLLI